MSTPLKRPFTEVSSTETDLGAGSIAYDEDGTKYIKCKALGAIATAMAVKADTSTAGTTERGFLVPGVVITAEIVDTDTCIGWNRSGTTLASGDFFWCTVGPIIKAVNCTGDLTTGEQVYCSATDGEVDDDATGVDTNLGIALTASTATNGLVDVLRVRGIG